MRYTPIARKLANPMFTRMALATAGVAGAYMSFLHLMQTSPAFANAVGQISPQLADTFACGCPLCTGAAAVCKGNEAFSTDTTARYQQWNTMLGHKPSAK